MKFLWQDSFLFLFKICFQPLHLVFSSKTFRVILWDSFEMKFEKSWRHTAPLFSSLKFFCRVSYCESCLSICMEPFR
jgi:hypothetical protein